MLMVGGYVVDSLRGCSFKGLWTATAVHLIVGEAVVDMAGKDVPFNPYVGELYVFFW